MNGSNAFLASFFFSTAATGRLGGGGSFLGGDGSGRRTVRRDDGSSSEDSSRNVTAHSVSLRKGRDGRAVGEGVGASDQRCPSLRGPHPPPRALRRFKADCRVRNERSDHIAPFVARHVWAERVFAGAAADRGEGRPSGLWAPEARPQRWRATKAARGPPKVNRGREMSRTLLARRSRRFASVRARDSGAKSSRRAEPRGRLALVRDARRASRACDFGSSPEHRGDMRRALRFVYSRGGGG